MGVVYTRGQQLGPDDLNVSLESVNGSPTNAAEVSYALFDVTTGAEVLVGPPQRTPANPERGVYYASVIIPLDANLGTYRIRWSFREVIGGPLHNAVQEFEVIARDSSAIHPKLTSIQAEVVRSFRIMLRDNDPDRNYRFRPPAHEETVGQFNQVFGFIWEDYELSEFLNMSVDMISASPPATHFRNADDLMTYRREWRTLMLTGAAQYALLALMNNWIAEEFSLAGDTLVRVKLPDGRELDVSLEDLYAVRSNQ